MWKVSPGCSTYVFPTLPGMGKMCLENTTINFDEKYTNLRYLTVEQHYLILVFILTGYAAKIMSKTCYY